MGDKKCQCTEWQNSTGNCIYCGLPIPTVKNKDIANFGEKILKANIVRTVTLVQRDDGVDVITTVTKDRHDSDNSKTATLHLNDVLDEEVYIVGDG